MRFNCIQKGSCLRKTGCTSRPVQLHSSTSFSEFLNLKKQVLKPPLKSIMPYLSCSSTNQSYGEHLSLKEHLISDCYPRMLTCVGNFIQTYDETTQRTLLIWVKFSTYLNLPLKLDIPVTSKQDWVYIFPSSKFILWLPTLVDVLLYFLTTPEVQRKHQSNF